MEDGNRRFGGLPWKGRVNFNTLLALFFLLFSVTAYILIPYQIEKPKLFMGRIPPPVHPVPFRHERLVPHLQLLFNGREFIQETRTEGLRQSPGHDIDCRRLHPIVRTSGICNLRDSGRERPDHFFRQSKLSHHCHCGHRRPGGNFSHFHPSIKGFLAGISFFLKPAGAGWRFSNGGPSRSS
jgi:hypothetical protein